ncbi:hypothetical protein [Xanthomonas arboricola]
MAHLQGQIQAHAVVGSAQVHAAEFCDALHAVIQQDTVARSLRA